MSTIKTIDISGQMILDRSEYDRYFAEVLSQITETLGTKAKEYVRNEDFMHNFNQGAKIKQTIREEVMEDFRLKHIISRNDLINDIKNGYELPSKEYVLEKYGDIINYYILEAISVLHRIDVEDRI